MGTLGCKVLGAWLKRASCPLKNLYLGDNMIEANTHLSWLSLSLNSMAALGCKVLGAWLKRASCPLKNSKEATSTDLTLGCGSLRSFGPHILHQAGFSHDWPRWCFCCDNKFADKSMHGQFGPQP
eukprot:gene23911-9482_t